MCENKIGNISIGDFVTAYGTGYWQLIDIKPKIAFDNYDSEGLKWKKGDLLGKWVILKKAFTNKMKPRISFTFEDASWLKPVPKTILSDIETYFEEHPDFKKKFDTAEVKLLPMISNVWIDLPEEREADFRKRLETLPERFTIDDLLNTIGEYRNGVFQPPAKYLLNLSAFPWDVDGDANLLFFDWELTKD